MPAELMERPRRGTGRTRSRAGRRKRGIPHLRRRGPGRTRGGAAGDPRGDLGPPDARLERSRAHPERSPAGPALGARPGTPRSGVALPVPAGEAGGLEEGNYLSSAGCSRSVTNFREGEQLLRVLI